MKHISILIPIGHSSLSNIEGTYQILSTVNEMLLNNGMEPLFDVNLVGIERETKQAHGLFSIMPNQLINEVEKTDLVIIPAIHGNYEDVAAKNAQFLPWITKQYSEGAEVASLCIAAFFLARTGLLNGRKATTHWMHANEFKMMFPQVNLLDDKIMTAEQGIYTSGGAYSYLNLLMYLVEVR